MKKVFVFLLFLAVLGAGFRINSAPAASTDVFFAIPAGLSARGVARDLEKNNHIRSARWFLALARLRGATRALQAGVYEIRAGQSASKILSDMTSGRTRRLRVTVPEGFASWQIAERLEAAGVCPAADFRAAAAAAQAEGYLFPETYYFENNVPAAAVLGTMRAGFDNAWAKVVSGAQAAGAVAEVLPSTAPAAEERLRLADGRLWTRRQVVALASLVEREARRPEERALISAVFHNRLKKRMRLESDPTVQFSLGYWKERIFLKDLDAKSPYNTYRNFGLPPGPICSPGAPALAAALAPARVDYLYFVADESGGHRFSATYGNHLRSVRERDARRQDKKRGRR